MSAVMVRASRMLARCVVARQSRRSRAWAAPTALVTWGRHVLIFAIGVGALALPATSLAYVPSPTIDAHLDDVAQWAVRNAPLAPQSGLQCGSVCTNLWLEEHRPIPNSPSSEKLWQELRGLERRTGLWPEQKFRWSNQILLRAGAGLLAADIGWRLGSGIHAKYIEGRAPALDNQVFSSTQWALVPSKVGEQIQWGWTTGLSGTPPVADPELWYLVRASSNNGRLAYQQAPAGTCNQPFSNVVPNWASFLAFAEGTSPSGCFYRDFQGVGHYTDLSEVGWAYPESKLFAGPPRDLEPGDAPTIWTDDVPASPSLEALRPTVEAELKSGQYPFLSDWLEFGLGQADRCNPLAPAECNPPAAWHTTPFPNYDKKWDDHRWDVCPDCDFQWDELTVDDYRTLADDIANDRYEKPQQRCVRPRDGATIILTDDGILVIIKNGEIDNMYPLQHSDRAQWFDEECKAKA